MRQTTAARPRWALLALLSFPTFAGCGSDDGVPREPISGKVTLDGQPLPKGKIDFTPSGADQRTTGSAPIQDGSYSLARGQGLVPGSYAVRIYAGVDPVGSPDEMPGEPGSPPKEPIPSKYNSKTTLGAEVTKDGENTFDFALTTS